jgi:hypothetical protein
MCRGTSGAHERENCPETLRTAEISTAGQAMYRAADSQTTTSSEMSPTWHLRDELACYTLALASSGSRGGQAAPLSNRPGFWLGPACLLATNDHQWKSSDRR